MLLSFLVSCYVCTDTYAAVVWILRTECSMTWEKYSCPWILSLVTYICTLHYVPTDLQCLRCKILSLAKCSQWSCKGGGHKLDIANIECDYFYFYYTVSILVTYEEDSNQQFNWLIKLLSSLCVSCSHLGEFNKGITLFGFIYCHVQCLTRWSLSL